MKISTKRKTPATIAVIIGSLGLLTLLTAADCDDTQPQKPKAITVELENGDKVSCVVLPDETETVYEEMSCFKPDGQPTAKDEK